MKAQALLKMGKIAVLSAILIVSVSTIAKADTLTLHCSGQDDGVLFVIDTANSTFTIHQPTSDTGPYPATVSDSQIAYNFGGTDFTIDRQTGIETWETMGEDKFGNSVGVNHTQSCQKVSNENKF